MGHCLEAAIPLLDFTIRKVPQAIEAELLDIERRHDTPEDDGLADAGLADIARIRQVAHEAAREGIPCPSWIEHLFEGIRRRRENRRIGEHQDPVFAPLYDQCFNTERKDFPGGLHEIGLLGKLARFRVIDYEDINLPDHLFQRLRLGGYPLVHGIAGDNPGILYLGQDIGLQFGIDVGKKKIFRIGILKRNRRLECLEHIEFCL